MTRQSPWWSPVRRARRSKPAQKASLSVQQLECRDTPAFAGTGTGLIGDYYSDTNLTNLAFARTDAGVNFDWGTAAPAAGVPADGFSARWTGRVQAQASETYTFTVTADEGYRLYVGGQTLVDAWTSTTPSTRSATIPLAAGETYDLRLEYVDRSGAANVRLSWGSPSTPAGVVPAAQLYAGGGWLNADLGTPAVSGSMAGTAGGFTVRGAGTLGGTADQGHFGYQPLSEDGEVTAAVTDLSGRQGGLMLRGSAAADAPFAAVSVLNGQVVFQARGTAGATATQTALPGGSDDDDDDDGSVQLRLVRNGALVSGYAAWVGDDDDDDDGGSAAARWVHVGTARVVLDTTAHAGLFAASGSSSQTATARFAAVAVRAAVPVGANLDAVNDWSLANPFVDIFKQAREFRSLGRPGQPAQTNADGWATEDFETFVQSGFLNTGKVYNGTYKLSFTGRADVGLSVTPGTLSNVQYNSATNTTTADIRLNASDSDGGWYFALQFRNTGGGVRNVRLIRPGYDPANPPVFTNQFLDVIKGFSTLRFMDWLRTNDNHVTEWAQRAKATDATQATHRGVAWEYVIELANQTGKDLWVCVPYGASNDYVRNLAELLKARVNPDRAVYVEWSNEVWNGQFSQTIANRDAAVAEVQAGMAGGTPSNLFYPGETNKNPDGTWASQWDWAFRRVARRITEISNTFAQVWGADALNARVRPVLATQSAVPYILKTQLEFVDKVYGDPSRFLYAAAGAPYFFVGAANNNPAATVDDILNGLRAGIAEANEPLNHLTHLTTYYGLKHLAYEGGPDTFGGNAIAAKKAASLDPRMKTLIADYLTDWYKRGGGLFAWFVAGPTNFDTPYGTWGVTNDITNLNAPKAQGIEQVRTGPVVAPTVGRAVAGEVLARDYVAGANPTSDPYPRYLNNGDYRDYMVRVPAAGTYALTLRYAQVNPGGQLQVLANDRPVQTLTLPVTGPGYDSLWAPNTFADAQPVTLSLNEGLNVIRLRVVSSGFTLYSLKFAAPADGTSPPTSPPPTSPPPTSPPPTSPPPTSPPPTSPPPTSPPPATGGSTVSYPSGFAGATLVRNGSAVLNGSRLRLTTAAGQAGSAYTPQPVAGVGGGFSTAFRFQLGSLDGSPWSIGDGLAFAVQRQGATALGATGSGLGFDGVFPGAAVRFNAVRNAIELSAGGTVTSTGLAAANIELRHGGVFRAEVRYDGTALAVTLTDTATGRSATARLAVNLATAIGGADAFAGFSAGTGVLAAAADVLDWTLTATGGGSPPPNQPPAVTAGPVPAVTGTGTVLTAAGTDDAGEAGLRYAWTLVSGPAGVSFSASGTNAAKAVTAAFTRAGAYTLRVTATDAGGLTAAADLAVTVSPTLTVLTVTPAAGSVVAGGTLAFTAAGRDQFGQPMTLTGVSWSALPGSITAAGVYTAPATAGMAMVTAAAAGRSTTVPVTVTAPAAASGINYGSGFTAGGLARNGSAALSGSRLRLAARTGQAGSAFASTAVGVGRFNTAFRFQMGSLDGSPWSLGDGLTFTLQRQGATALGAGGSGLGAAGIAPAVSLGFGVLANSVTLTAGGTVRTLNLDAAGLDLRSGRVFRAAVGYDGTALTVTLTDTASGKAATARWVVNLPAALGGSTAWAGFTAGTGALAGTLDVLDWTYTPG